jgi:hypothetical protein
MPAPDQLLRKHGYHSFGAAIVSGRDGLEWRRNLRDAERFFARGEDTILCSCQVDGRISVGRFHHHSNDVRMEIMVVAGEVLSDSKV